VVRNGGGERPKVDKEKEKEIARTDPTEIEALIERFKQSTHDLKKEDTELIEKLLRTFASLVRLLQRKNLSIRRLKRLLFGPQTEKLKEGKQNNQGEEKAGDPERLPEDEQQQRKKGGHGRNKVSAYSGAKLVKCRNNELKAGDECPQEGCLGHLYDLHDPVILLQFRGQPPITATNYEREVLRCAKCQERYTAPLPEGVTDERYTPSADATIAIMKYASGQPWYRQARLQKMSGVPLPESVQWERCEVMADAGLPVYLQLEKLGGNGELLYLDDTPVTILDWEKMKKRLPEKERKGTQTSVIIVEGGGRKIALYLSGRKHAGENLQGLLAQRSAELGPPIQVSDALAVNGSGDQPTIWAKCLVHARRKFFDLREIFPVPVKFVLDAIGKVYEYEGQTEGMTGEERLKHHQEQRGPVMEQLKEWMEKQLADHEVEPNSGLGEAIRYSLKHWSGLTQFLSIPGAPLDNNPAERGVKQFILFRKNSLFFKNERGAAVGNILTSLIETCRLNGVNPWDYLTYLRKNAAEVRKNPELCLPWNYANSQAEARAA
jgi:transposase